MGILDSITNFIEPQQMSVLLLLGIVLFLGTAGGRIFQKLKIPQVVGYIVVGIILGQSGIGFINKETVSSLQPFNSFALAIIGIMIGGELQFKILKKYGKSFITILLFEALSSFIVVAAFSTFGAWMIFHDLPKALALGLLLGAISSATAPAATTDVLWENKTKGPLTSTILGIVALDDGIALILFALATSIAGVLLGQTTQTLGMNILHLVYEIGGSVILGSVMGYGLSTIIREYLEEEKILAFSLGSLLLLIGLSLLLSLDMILGAMAMGFFMANYAPRKSKATFRLIKNFAPPIYVLFFVLVGAKLDISQLTTIVAILAGIFLVGRTSGKFLGAFLGARISGAPKTVQKYLPFCLLSQAGVAVGLSIVAGETFSEGIGDLIVILVTTTTFVVQIFGPIFVKYAVKKGGEIGLNITEEDLIRSSRAEDIINSGVTAIKENQNIESILKLYSENDNYVYPVVSSEDKLLGVITMDILKDTFMASEFSQFILAHDIMFPPPCTCGIETPLPEIYSLMKKKSVDYIPVVNPEGKVEGMIEQRAVSRLLSQKILEKQNIARELG
ncbi:MAG: cation:proton antiporter [Spirochaetales bacterium]|nr:cation:proton antiporter [Spirochaetales bacterium]